MTQFRSFNFNMEKDKLLVGRKPVVDALESATKLEKVWIDKDMKGELEKHMRFLCRTAKVPLQYVPKKKLALLSNNANHQGLVAQLAIVDYYSVEELLPFLYENGKTPFILVLDGIEDVRNMGALARSAVWFDCHGIIMPAKKSAMINSFAYKASAGAIKDILICRESSIVKAVEYLKNSGLQIVVADMNDSPQDIKIDLSEPLALVLGSEGQGVSKEIQDLADAKMMIPGSGRVESLNVSVAGAILMHQVFLNRS